MAAHEKGRDVVASKPESKRCSGTNAAGQPCKAWAMQGEDVCFRHSMSEEQWREMSKRGGRAKGRAARERREIHYVRHVGGKPEASKISVENAIREINRLLDSTLPDGEPNMLERSWGVLALVALFKLRHEQRAELDELLKRLRPSMRDSDRRRVTSDLRRAERELLRMFDAGLIDADELPPELLFKRRRQPVAAA